MPSPSHLSIVTTFSDWSHVDRVEVDDIEASSAWAAIQKAHLEDPQQRHYVASMTTPRGWYEPHVSRYPPPPRPPLHINVTPTTPTASSYGAPLIRPTSNLNVSTHNSRRTSGNDEPEEEFPPSSDPLTDSKVDGDVPNSHISTIGSVYADGFQIHRDSLLDSSCSSGTGGSAEYPLSASSSSNSGSGLNPSLKMSRRSGLVLSAVSVPAIEYKNEKSVKYKYQTNDLVEIFIVIIDVNGRRASKWIMGTVNSSDILPGWTSNGERTFYDIRYRTKYCHPNDPSTEIWGIFSEVEIRRLVPRLSNTPGPADGKWVSSYQTLLFIRSKILDQMEGKPKSTWFPCVCTEYGVFGLVGDYKDAMVPPDSRFRPCTQKALEDMHRDGSKILFPWSHFHDFSQAVTRSGLRAPQDFI